LACAACVANTSAPADARSSRDDALTPAGDQEPPRGDRAILADAPRRDAGAPDQRASLDGAVSVVPLASSLFIYQGDYAQLAATPEEIARLAARHSYAVFTHGFTVSPALGSWKRGQCIDTAYASLPTVIRRVRELNPAARLFGYVSATADAPTTCSGEALENAGGYACAQCDDFMRWVDRWVALPQLHPGAAVDGIFIDYVKPTIIDQATRDNLFSYVKLHQLRVMANGLSGVAGIWFAASAPTMTADDVVLAEGYPYLAGQLNPEAVAIEDLLASVTASWIALANEPPGVVPDCASARYLDARARALGHGARAFAFQEQTYGTVSHGWLVCP
jgi:hypothetical protein